MKKSNEYFLSFSERGVENIIAQSVDFQDIEFEIAQIMSNIIISDTIKKNKRKKRIGLENTQKMQLSLRVIFEVLKEDLQDIFDNELWYETDIEGAFQSEIGVETFIRWVCHAANSETHSYNAEMYFKHLSENSYRIHFCGFGVNSEHI